MFPLTSSHSLAVKTSQTISPTDAPLRIEVIFFIGHNFRQALLQQGRHGCETGRGASLSVLLC